jgi:hypothetical protein
MAILITGVITWSVDGQMGVNLEVIHSTRFKGSVVNERSRQFYELDVSSLPRNSSKVIDDATRIATRIA